jgi:hypothetical protein
LILSVTTKAFPEVEFSKACLFRHLTRTTLWAWCLPSAVQPGPHLHSKLSSVSTLAQPFQHVGCHESSPSVLVSVCTTCLATECEARALTAPASQRYFEFAFTTRHSRNASQTRFEHPALDYPFKRQMHRKSPNPRVNRDDKPMAEMASTREARPL